MLLRRRYGRRGKYIFRAVCVIMSLLTVFLLLDARIRPFIRRVALLQAENYAAVASETQIPVVLGDVNASYDSLVEITRDCDGNIVSVQTDAMRMNLIKSKINASIAAALGGLTARELGIPIGSLTGLALLNGRGPKINVILSLTGSAQTQFVNSFDSAGINQTRHRIFLVTTVTLAVVFPTTTLTTAYTTQMLAAETVIVGKVPLAFGEVTQK